jgi:hypothetical protein
MFNFLIKDGNLKEWVRIFCVVIGIGFVAMGIVLKITSLFGGLLFLLGFVFAAIGGYAAQAHTLRLKPFDNSYKKARASYESDEKTPHS